MMLHAWGATYERIEWYEGAAFHVVFVATCAIVFALYPTTRLIKRLRRGAPGPDGRPARWCAVAIALANLLFMVWLVFSLRGLGASAPLPAATSYGSRCH
jgi:predicted PurR-regulated permease PerM